MTSQRYRNLILTVIAVVLASLLLRPVFSPPPAEAQADRANYYVEPGVVSLRTVDGANVGQGKIVIDLRSGDIWGFQNGANGAIYPVYPNENTPPVVKPIYLGRYDFGAMTRPATAR